MTVHLVEASLAAAQKRFDQCVAYWDLTSEGHAVSEARDVAGIHDGVLIEVLEAYERERKIKLSDEQARLLHILLKHVWPQIDLRGTIEFFGLEGEDVGDDTAMRRMSGALDELCEAAGFERPPPSMGRSLGPRR